MDDKNILHDLKYNNNALLKKYSFLAFFCENREASACIFALLLILISFFRIILFLVTQDVGIEHDSGWLLGAAKNLASSGKYASYSNLSEDSAYGLVMNMWQEPNLQDAERFTYFPQAISVGMGYVFPQALLLKIFGMGYWQYRLWPLVGYFVLLRLLLYLSYKVGRKIGMFLVFLLVYARPEIFTNQSFEAFSESWSLIYFLISIIVLDLLLKSNKLSPNIAIIAGILYSLSLQTKSISLLFAPGIFIFLCIIANDFGKNVKEKLFVFFRTTLSFSLGMMMPIILFEFFKYIQLKTLFGFQAYFITFIETFIGYKKHAVVFNSDFVKAKYQFWSFIFGDNYNIVWTLVILLPIYLWRSNVYKSKALFYSLWVSSFTMLMWFVFLSPNGWLRHTWPAVLLFIILITSVSANFISNFKNLNLSQKVYCVIALILVASSFISSKQLNFSISKDFHNSMWRKWAINGETLIQGFYSHPVFSWHDQIEMKEFIEQLPNNRQIFYLSYFYVSEMSAISGRVFLPISSVLEMPDLRLGYIIIGPYQKGELSRVEERSLNKAIVNLCDKTVFKNNSYYMCSFTREKIILQ